MGAFAEAVPFRATQWLFRLRTSAQFGRAPDGGDYATTTLSGVQRDHSLRCKHHGDRMSRENGLAPHLMSPEARLSELGRIVAAGVLRMRQQSSSISADDADSSLAIPATKSVSRPRAQARIGGR